MCLSKYSQFLVCCVLILLKVVGGTISWIRAILNPSFLFYLFKFHLLKIIIFSVPSSPLTPPKKKQIQLVKAVKGVNCWGSYLTQMLEFMRQCFFFEFLLYPLCYVCCCNLFWRSQVSKYRSMFQQCPISVQRPERIPRCVMCGSCRLHIVCIIQWCITKLNRPNKRLG